MDRTENGEAGRQYLKGKIAITCASAFVLVALLIIANHVAVVPLLDIPAGSVNWLLIGVDVFFVLIVGLFAVYWMSRLESEHEQAEELYLAMANSSQIGVYIVQDRKFLLVNPYLEKVTGFNEERLLGSDPLELVHPEDREMVRKNAISMLKGERWLPYEFRIVGREGDIKSVMEVLTSVRYKGRQATLASFMDITWRKEMEEQLIVADRLASVGELAAGIAHELNNPLTSILGFTQLILEKNTDEDVKRDMSVVFSEARRAAGVVTNLLAFARKYTPTKQMVDVNSIIKKVLAMRAYEQRVDDIHVVTKLAPSLPGVIGDSFRLQQVFLNIVINAEYFMIESNKGGTLTVTTEGAGGFVRALVADDGPGIRRENLGRVFDPFFTTKEVGKGTGLGLSICHGIVTGHGGRIHVESEPGKGATFIVELPVADFNSQEVTE